MLFEFKQRLQREICLELRILRIDCYNFEQYEFNAQYYY